MEAMSLGGATVPSKERKAMEAHTRVAYMRIASREDGHPLWGGRCYFDTSPLS